MGSIRRPARRRAALLLAVLVLAGAFVPAGARVLGPAAPRTACAHVEVVAVGPACRLPNGLYAVTMPDGTTLTTHGGDGPHLVRPSAAFAATPASKLACTDKIEDEFHVEVFYAHAANAKSNYAKMHAEVERIFLEANEIMASEARRVHRTMNMRVYCTGGHPVIPELKLPTPKSQTSFYSVARDMDAMGYRSRFAKYWVWFDGRMGPVLGTGSFLGDDRATTSNRNMRERGYAITWGQREREGAALTMMHEGSHNFGGVQNSAPHTTGAGHCIDGEDVMCYPDGGPFQNKFRLDFCSSRIWYDCGHNDYFNPVPSKGSYLATHWNIGSPANRFMAGCTYRTGTLSVGLQGQDPEASIPKEVPSHDAVAARSHSISRTCWGHPWAISAAPMSESAQGTVAQHTDPPPPDALPASFDVCFLKKSATLRCSTGTADMGTVPTGATTVRVSMTQGLQGVYVFNAI